MNERINKHANEFFSVMPDSRELEEYSNQLIKLCAQLCKTVSGDQVANASKDYQEGREMGAMVCYHYIRKYFEIEE